MAPKKNKIHSNPPLFISFPWVVITTQGRQGVLLYDEVKEKYILYDQFDRRHVIDPLDLFPPELPRLGREEIKRFINRFL